MPSLRRPEQVPSAHDHPTTASLLNPPLATLPAAPRRPRPAAPPNRPFLARLARSTTFSQLHGFIWDPSDGLSYPSSDTPCGVVVWTVPNPATGWANEAPSHPNKPP